MSINCINCGINRRTKLDLLCDDCRDYAERLQILEDLTSDDPCSLDHDGNCQTHNWFGQDRPCPQKRIKDLRKDS